MVCSGSQFKGKVHHGGAGMAVGMSTAAGGHLSVTVVTFHPVRKQKGMYVSAHLTFSSLQTSTLDNRMVHSRWVFQTH